MTARPKFPDKPSTPRPQRTTATVARTADRDFVTQARGTRALWTEFRSVCITPNPKPATVGTSSKKTVLKLIPDEERHPSGLVKGVHILGTVGIDRVSNGTTDDNSAKSSPLQYNTCGP